MDGAIMEKLLASRYARSKLTSLYRGLKVEGEVVLKGDKEITLDIGAKSEGILQNREIPKSQLDNLKFGDRLKAYVLSVENEFGQVVLTAQPPISLTRTFAKRSRMNWSKFTQAQSQNTKLKGKVLEINKGGLIVEVDGVRGFLPNSQIGFDLLSKAGSGMEGLSGQEINVSVIEIDSANNRLIFSQRGQVSDNIQAALKNFKNNQKISGQIVAILPFGLIVDVLNTEGIVFISDVSWEKVEDLSELFKIGQEIEAIVTGIDEELGRLNLSIKHLMEDPFDKLTKEISGDQVVKGEIVSISESGVLVKLSGGLEGFIRSSKLDPATKYEAGQQISCLVDSVDKAKRRINLAPMITTTEGLIYK